MAYRKLGTAILVSAAGDMSFVAERHRHDAQHVVLHSSRREL